MYVDNQELQIFQTLADRVCVFDFLMARGFKGADWMELFRQRLRVVRESLEEDRSAAWWSSSQLSRQSYHLSKLWDYSKKTSLNVWLEHENIQQF